MNSLKLTSINSKKDERTVIAVDNVKVGKDFVVIGGPCSVESEEQTLETARKVKEAGGNMLRYRRHQQIHRSVETSMSEDTASRSSGNIFRIPAW